MALPIVRTVHKKLLTAVNDGFHRGWKSGKVNGRGNQNMGSSFQLLQDIAIIIRLIEGAGAFFTGAAIRAGMNCPAVGVNDRYFKSVCR